MIYVYISLKRTHVTKTGQIKTLNNITFNKFHYCVIEGN